MGTTNAWTPDELARIDAEPELHIASRREDGTWRRAVPIWAVHVGGQVYVRTWYRRDTGWYGAALATGRARVRVPGLESDVVVEDVGDGTPELRSAVDAAYRDKYGGSGAGRMVGDEAASTTLRLVRSDGDAA